jgi:hypothetical protein
VLHVRVRLPLRVPRESVHERCLGVGHLSWRTQAEDDRETLAREGAAAREGGHRGLLLPDPLRFVDVLVAAVQEEVPQRAVCVHVPAQDGLVVHLQVHERGGGHRVTGLEVDPGAITLSWHGMAWTFRGRRGA